VGILNTSFRTFLEKNGCACMFWAIEASLHLKIRATEKTQLKQAQNLKGSAAVPGLGQRRIPQQPQGAGKSSQGGAWHCWRIFHGQTRFIRFDQAWI